MNRTTCLKALTTALLMGTLALAGCTAGTTTEASHPTDGVWGYVAAADDAKLEVSGTAGPAELDFSMDDPAGSPDRPYFVDAKELAVVVPVE